MFCLTPSFQLLQARRDVLDGRRRDERRQPRREGCVVQGGARGGLVPQQRGVRLRSEDPMGRSQFSRVSYLCMRRFHEALCAPPPRHLRPPPLPLTCRFSPSLAMSLRDRFVAHFSHPFELELTAQQRPPPSAWPVLYFVVRACVCLFSPPRKHLCSAFQTRRLSQGERALRACVAAVAPCQTTSPEYIQLPSPFPFRSRSAHTTSTTVSGFSATPPSPWRTPFRVPRPTTSRPGRLSAPSGSARGPSSSGARRAFPT